MPLRSCKNYGTKCRIINANGKCPSHTFNAAARDEARFWRLVAKHGGELYRDSPKLKWRANIMGLAFAGGTTRLSAIRAALRAYDRMEIK